MRVDKCAASDRFHVLTSAAGSVLIIPHVHRFWSLSCCFGWSSEKRSVVLSSSSVDEGSWDCLHF